MFVLCCEPVAYILLDQFDFTSDVIFALKAATKLVHIHYVNDVKVLIILLWEQWQYWQYINVFVFNVAVSIVTNYCIVIANIQC